MYFYYFLHSVDVMTVLPSLTIEVLVVVVLIIDTVSVDIAIIDELLDTLLLPPQKYSIGVL